MRYRIVAALTASLLWPAAAAAQSYPSQDVRFICAFPAGSGADIIVRYFAEKMRPHLKRSVIVENKAGASGNIATEAAARSKPDGHTIYVHSGATLAANMHLFKKPPVDAAKDIQVVATLNRQAFMMVVRPDRPWQKVADVTAYLKDKKDKASYGWSATFGKVMGEYYKAKAGVQAVDVSYRTGADTLNDLNSGALDYVMMDPQLGLSLGRENKVRILAISSKNRFSGQPDLPTMHEVGIADMDLVGWFSAMVPKATPRPIQEQLNGWFNEIVATSETKEFLQKQGGDPWINRIDDAQAFLEKEIKAWGDYVKLARIEPQ